MVPQLQLVLLCSCVYLTHTSLIPLTRDFCAEGYLLWPIDSACYRPYSQGPCDVGRRLVPTVQGPLCQLEMELDALYRGVIDQEMVYLQEQILGEAEEEAVPGWLIPDNITELTGKEAECLEEEKVFWPDDGKCYALLTQGPCPDGAWLALNNTMEGDFVMCKNRTCPCDHHHPELCEVEMEGSSCKCHVALAAAQDGLCSVGEQLLVGPYGTGVCGCIVTPPHSRWPVDDRCYPLHTQGPCNPGFILKMSSSRLEPTCQPNLCSHPAWVFWAEDAQCYELGTQGPCDPVEILEIDSETLEIKCTPNPSKVKRVYDIIPNNRRLMLDAPVSASLKIDSMDKCVMDSRGKCRKSFFIKKSRGGGRSRLRRRKQQRNKLAVRKRKPRQYINWLQSFRRR